MIDRKSRYAQAGTLKTVTPDGEPIELIDRRTVAAKPTATTHLALDHDRLDLLAHRYLGDPLAWWRIADAADVLDPFDIVVPGRPVPIPEP